MGEDKRKHQAKLLRTLRKIHRTMGALLFTLFFLIAVTGLLLGWKRHSGGYLLATSYPGTSTDLKEWLPLDSLHRNACKIFRDSISNDLPLELERIDIRQTKGMAKFLFKNHFWAIQLDGATGKLLHIERRRSDFIEKLHDGSMLDYLLGTTGEYLKLAYTSLMGISLLTFTITGFWLWYGPKRMRKELRADTRTLRDKR